MAETSLLGRVRFGRDLCLDLLVVDCFSAYQCCTAPLSTLSHDSVESFATTYVEWESRRCFIQKCVLLVYTTCLCDLFKLASAGGRADTQLGLLYAVHQTELATGILHLAGKPEKHHRQFSRRTHTVVRWREAWL